MPTLKIEPLHPEFGARVSGVDLRLPVAEAAFEEIRVAMDEHSLLCFPGQPFDDDRQLAFTKKLGEPEQSHVKLGEAGKTTYFGTIGNVQPDGGTLGNADKKTIFLTGNNMWHTDSSFREVPAKFSIMCVYEVPDEGGETAFVSTRAAYGRLPDDMKATIDPLLAVHDYVFSRSKVSPDAVSPALGASLPPVQQKLVRCNPRTGEKNYFIGSHAKAVVGWRDEQSRSLLDDLLARATGDAHVYRHAWQPGELVIWDNRCLLHRGSGYDADRHRRYMRQTRVRGAGSTLTE